MKKAAISLILSICLNLYPILGWPQTNSQTAEIQISAQISSPSIRMGDTLAYTIILTWPGEQGRYLIEELAPPVLENLHLARTKSELSLFQENQTNYTRKKYKFYIATDSIGPARIEELTINYYDTKTDKSDSFVAPAYEVKVKAASAAGQRFLWFLLAVAILLGLGYVLRFYRKIKKPADDSLGTKTLEQRALEKTLNLSGEDAKNTLTQLKKIVIEYLESKTGQSLTGRTTNEILASLTGFENGKKETLRQVLEECDRARFNPDLTGQNLTKDTVEKFNKLLELEGKELVE